MTIPNDPGQEGDAGNNQKPSDSDSRSVETSGAKPATDPAQKPNENVEVVQPDQILRQAGMEGTPLKFGTFTQRAGLRLAAGVGGLAVVVTLLIVYKWMAMVPVPPDLGVTLSKEQVGVVTDGYKALHEQAFDAASKLFDSIITKALLPVFTSILGYIFGARSTSDTTSSSS